MRTPGVEPGSQAWKACMIPLHYVRNAMHAAHLAVWSSGMIPASGAGGPGFNSRNSPVSAHRPWRCQSGATPPPCKPTPVGFEPTRGDPIGVAGRRRNHSVKVSLARSTRNHGTHTHTHTQTHTHTHTRTRTTAHDTGTAWQSNTNAKQNTPTEKPTCILQIRTPVPHTNGLCK